MGRFGFVLLVAGCYEPGALPVGDGASDGQPMPDSHVIGDAPPGAPCIGASNGLLGVVCREPTEPFNVMADLTLDTTDDGRCDPTANNFCLVAGTSIHIEGTLSVIGSRPLVLWTDSTIVVDGTIDASSRRGSPLKLGPAANYPDCPSPDGAQDGGLPDFGSGGGGGGYATAGGKGGEGAGNNGAVSTSGSSPLQPIGLRGGCAGGAGGALGQMTPGIGGGAVYLMAASITVGGIITVNGSGGGGGVGGLNVAGGGGGGGSGGMIGLDAETVMLDTAMLSALGGGGGSGGLSGPAPMPGNPGNDPGIDPPSAAPGGGQTANTNFGGPGSSTDGTTVGNGGNATAAAQMTSRGGGGGGGAAGYIRVFTSSLEQSASNVAPPLVEVNP